LGGPPTFDGIEYDMLAVNIANGGGFALTPGVPYSFHPPGFPAFLAVVFTIFGHNLSAVRIFDAAFSALTCIPVYLFTKRIWNWQSGLLAAAGIAVHPLLIYLTSLIYPESLILLLIAIILWLTVAFWENKRLSTLVLIGFSGSLGIYLRPNLILWCGLLGLWLLLVFNAFKPRLVSMLLFASIVGVCILPWSIRNFVVTGNLTWMSTNGGVTFWSGNNQLANGGWVEPGPQTWLKPDPPPDLHGWPNLSEKQSEDRFFTEAKNWIQANPGQAIGLIPRKVIRALELNFGNESRSLSIPRAVSYLYDLFMLAALAGAVLSWRAWKTLLPAYGLAFVSLVTSMIFYGSTRQSAVLIPVLVSLAASAAWKGLSWGWNLWQRRRVGKF